MITEFDTETISDSTRPIENVIANLRRSPKRWLITGAAGFIGSNLLEKLLENNQFVVGLDNLETGFQRNLENVRSQVSETQWKNFTFINGDIRNPDDCAAACSNVDIVLHQAALGSVPRSIKNPARTNSTNIDGFLNMLIAAVDANISRFVYAASSSTYGDHNALPKIESAIGVPLSPYAVTKVVNELYANVFCRHYGIEPIGLRYFNVFGPRQSPNGAYAAVIPRWMEAMLNGQPITINGDGCTSRDFCFIDNVVQANVLAATAPASSTNEVYNVALNAQTSLQDLADMMAEKLIRRLPDLKIVAAKYNDFRAGDVMHSRADISKAASLLGYQPTHTLNEGLEEAIDWYLAENTWTTKCSQPGS